MRFLTRLASATAIFAAAFLLFLVQPLIAKTILPWFGGAAAVWTACMLFFQSMLLAGYAYADVLTRRLSGRAQAVLHTALVTASLLALPIIPSERWRPGGAGDPTAAILGLLGGTIGAPFFLLASTSPLVQAWAARSAAATSISVYRLYALSNVGSFLALLAYPLLLEPELTTRSQAIAWSLGYVAFAALSIACAWGAPAASATPPAALPRAERRNRALPFLWIGLPAAGSTLLLAITNRICHDLSVMPVFWVLPLAVYLATFILCFESDRWYHRRAFLWMMPFAVGGVFHTISLDLGFAVRTALPAYGFGLFVGCMICHGELARLRPPRERLTVFYLCLALGGALGGLFVGVVAPRLFHDFLELPIAIYATVVLAFLARLVEPEGGITVTRRSLRAAAVVAGLVAGLFAAAEVSSVSRFRAVTRDFYGVLRVEEIGIPGSPTWQRGLWHGITNHGMQFLSAERRREPTSYYGPTSGIRTAIEDAGRQEPIRVGVMGLGAGVLASLGRPGDLYRFYEIDPLVVDLARSEFTFLEDSDARVEVRIGDARLLLEGEPPQGYDVIVADAFSSDAVPVHLITREAFEIYFRHLKAEGILVMHVTNRHLDLVPVVRGAVQALGKHMSIVVDLANPAAGFYGTTVVLVADRPGRLPPERLPRPMSPEERRRSVLWTDDWSSLLGVLKTSVKPDKRG